MKKYTKQQAFNIAYLGLKAQGFERAVSDKEQCQYRAPDGKRCAFGHLLSDKLYRSSFENKAAFAVINNLCDLNISHPFTFTDRGFYDNLQEVHDNGYTPEVMEEGLKLFAKNNNLTIPS